MSTTTKPDDLDALRTVIDALEPFDRSDKERIIRWAIEKLGIDGPKFLTSPQNISIGGQAPPPVGGTGPDIKSFIASKAPQSDNHLAAVVAYYYKFEAPVKKESITKEDILNACRLAGTARPKRPQQTLVNAHQIGLLDKGSDKGSYEINSVGENLVAVTLPASSTGTPPKRKGRTTKKGKVKKSKK